MKINNKKIIVSTLALAMGAALAGSISGSVAWYQYSTRATSTLSGTSAGTSRNLQIAGELVDDEADDNLDDAHWGYNVDGGAKSMAPVTPEFNEGVITGFDSHPIYQYFNNWIVSPDSNYFSYDLYFQSLNTAGEREALDVYLTAYNVAGSAAGTIIEDALRVELVPYTFDGSKWSEGTVRILSKSAETTAIKDYLNLNTPGNNIMDHNGFKADDSDGAATMYKANTRVAGAVGDAGAGLFTDGALSNAAATDGEGKLTADGTYFKANQDSYSTATASSIIAGDADPYLFTNKAGNVIVSTATDYAVKVTVKVWLEGWQKGANGTAVSLKAGDSGVGYYTDATCTTPAADTIAADGTFYAKSYIWDNSNIGKDIQLGLRFAVEAQQ